ncbi:hypothetical protein PSAC2689_30570 [Paraburkholderia sacchari]
MSGDARRAATLIDAPARSACHISRIFGLQIWMILDMGLMGVAWTGLFDIYLSVTLL